MQIDGCRLDTMRSDLCQQFTLDETVSRRARDLVEPLRDALAPVDFDGIRQVIAELVAQCANDAPAGMTVEVRLRVIDDVAELEVHRPPLSGVPDLDDHTRAAARIAFKVVDGLVDGWGVREDSDGVTVWVRLSLSHGATS